MKLFRGLIPILFFIIFMPEQGIAQRRYNRMVAAAEKAYESCQFNTALNRYKKAYSRTRDKDKKNFAMYQMAECYRLINNTKRAEVNYRRLLRPKYEEKEPLVLLHYADMLLTNEKYDLAEEAYHAFNELAPEDERGNIGLESVRLAREWLENPTKYEVTNERKINSREDDFAPSYADRNYNSIIFTSNRDGITGKGKDDWTDRGYSDLFYARRDPKGDWGTPISIDNQEVVNSQAHEGVAEFTQRFTNLYFTRCYGIKTEEEPDEGCQIYKATREENSWTEPVKIDLGGDSTSVIGHPTLSSDELTIIFSSNFEGGYGGKDLWMATRSSATEEFGLAKNLGELINTMGDEMFPFLRDDTILYFSSNGHPGMGGLDIYKSSLVNGEWQKPVNMQYPINSPGDDFGITFKPDEEVGFFSSNRRGGRGGDDIYSFIKPPLVFNLQGIVRNEATLQYISDASIKMVGTDGSSVEARTDPKGFYSFAPSQIKPNTTYELTVDQQGFFIKTGKITTVDVFANKDFTVDFLLEPIPDKPIPLPEIRYELAKWDLLPQYKDSLQGLITILDNNPTIIVELAAHTDSRNTFEFNDILSQKRAESVVNYLIERGIASDRLMARGYGKRVPRTLEKDITINGYTFKENTLLDDPYIESLPTLQHKEAAHQLNRRTEFKVLSRDYVPKRTTKKPTDIQIVVNPEENIITYRSGDKGEIYVPCILNRYNLIFTLNTNNKNDIELSLDQALKLLNDGAINRNDFEGDAEKIIGAGTIADKAVFTIRELRIGDKTVKDLKATINHRQSDPLSVGENILNQFGEFTINKENRQIIFK
ncbi:MAG: OmpA family protein [Bacteroidales bacterium]|nr:OmpA family protein [Bacteroidales bacterium]